VIAERKAMITRTHALPVVRQCQLLALSRSTAYYQPTPVSATDLALMRRIDALHLDHPFAGARMLRDLLRRAGHSIGRRHVSTLMTRMGIKAVYRKPHTSQRHPAHPVYPYLLRNVEITRSNHVWAADITYLPMHRGFVYLCAVMDWASRRVLAWRLSNTLTTDFCMEAVQEAVTNYGVPTIFNTDQGCQFTSLAFTGILKAHGIQISMDGTGCWRDNVFVERLWKSIKYEEVYLHAYETVSAAQQGVDRYLTFYNQHRPHRALDGKTPEQVYCDNLTTRLTAA
jgi:putative transposase